MKKIHTVLLGGVMAFALAACSTTDTTSGSSSMGAATAGSTGNPTIDAQMGLNPTDAPTASGNASTGTNTGHTTTSSDTRQ